MADTSAADPAPIMDATNGTDLHAQKPDISGPGTKGWLDGLPVIGAVTSILDATRMASEAKDIRREEYRAEQDGELDPHPEYTIQAHNDYLLLTTGYAAAATGMGTEFQSGTPAKVGAHLAFNQWAHDYDIPEDLQERLAPNVPTKKVQEYLEDHPGGSRGFASDVWETGQVWVDTYLSYGLGYDDMYNELGIPGATEATRRAVEHWRELRGNNKEIDGGKALDDTQDGMASKTLAENVGTDARGVDDLDSPTTTQDMSAREAIGFLASVDDQIGDMITTTDGVDISKAEVIERFGQLAEDDASLSVEIGEDMTTEDRVSAIVTAGVAGADQHNTAAVEVAEDEMDYAL